MTRTQARLLVGAEHPCSYLPDRASRSQFVDPDLPLDSSRYGKLLELGFRRSGGFVYRPACRNCVECRAARVLVPAFRADRNQRRCRSRNADLLVRIEGALDDEHFDLYRRYLRARHPGGGMDPEDRDGFHSFLTPVWGQTEILAIRAPDGTLLAGAVTDRLPQGLSAVYTYFDPVPSHRSLGTFSVLKQLDWAQELGLPHLYLGFWVPGSETMDYKRRFQPLEVLTTEGWRPGH